MSGEGGFYGRTGQCGGAGFMTGTRSVGAWLVRKMMGQAFETDKLKSNLG